MMLIGFGAMGELFVVGRRLRPAFATLELKSYE